MSTQEELQKRRRRKCSTTHSLEEEIIQDCKDAERAKTTADAYDYTFKEKVISAAKKQAELIHNEYKDTDQLEKELRTVSSKIRDRFTNEGHKREASRLISKEFAGKYTHKYTPEDYELMRYGKMQEYPECTDITTDAIEKMEEARSVINSDIMSDKAKNDLDDTTKDLRVDSVRWAKRNSITWNYRTGDDQTPLDLNLNKFNKKKISLRPDEVPEDMRTRAMQKLQIQQYDQQINTMKALKESLEKYNYISPNPEVYELVLMELLKMHSRSLLFVFQYFKICHMLTPEERKSALPMLLSEMYQLDQVGKKKNDDNVPFEAGKKELLILAYEMIKALEEIGDFLN